MGRPQQTALRVRHGAQAGPPRKGGESQQDRAQPRHQHRARHAEQRGDVQGGQAHRERQRRLSALRLHAQQLHDLHPREIGRREGMGTDQPSGGYPAEHGQCEEPPRPRVPLAGPDRDAVHAPCHEPRGQDPGREPEHAQVEERHACARKRDGPYPPAGEQAQQDEAEQQRHGLGADHHVAVQDVGYRQEEEERPQPDAHQVVALRDPPHTTEQDHGEDQAGHADPHRDVVVEGERHEREVEPPPHVGPFRSDDRERGPRKGRVERSDPQVVGRVAHVVEGVDVGDLRGEEQVEEEDHPDDTERGREAGAVHPPIILPASPFSQRSHHCTDAQ